MKTLQNKLIRGILLMFGLTLTFDAVERCVVTHSAKASPAKTAPTVVDELPQRVERVSAEGKTVKILLCSSCGGYKQRFDELKSFLESEFSDLHVTSEAYPLSKMNSLLAKTLTVIQFSVMGLLSFGDRLLPAFGIPVPAIVAQMQQKKIAIIVGTFMVGNMLGGSLRSTGAFEVFVDGKLLHSKLSTGQFVTNREMENLLKHELITK